MADDTVTLARRALIDEVGNIADQDTLDLIDALIAAVRAENTPTIPQVAAMLTVLKEECERQHVRANTAEAALAAVRAVTHSHPLPR